MAVAIGFKKVQSLPDSPLMTTFYLVNNEDLYIGDKKLNNEIDLQAAIDRIANLENAIASGSGTGPGGGITPITSGAASNISVQDADNHFQSNNVEGALAELAERTDNLSNLFDSHGDSISELTNEVGDLKDIVTDLSNKTIGFEDAIADLAARINAGGGTFSEYTLLRLTPDDFTGTANEGGRTWSTATVPITGYSTNVIHAVPCGDLLGEMPTVEQERRVYALKAYLYPDDNNIIFYSPAVPEADITMALEGIELT